MGTLLINDPAPTDDLLSFERVSSGWATGTAWDQAWATNPAMALVHQAETAAAGGNISAEVPIQGLERIANNQPPPRLTPEQADEQFGIPGQLSFKDYANGITPEHAKLLHGWKQDEIRRADILSRSTPGVLSSVARFGAGIGASVLDPINIATAFIPVLPEARFAALVGKVGLTGARLARGALEGAAGQAAIEPLILLQAQSEQADYDAYDSLLNITFGALIGAGLHAGGGFIKDRIVGAPDLRSHVTPLTAETHHTALSGAVAAVAEDRPVEVADFVKVASRRDELMSGTSIGRRSALEPSLSGEEPGLPRVPAEEAAARRVQTVEARAREIDPETFKAFDGLAQEKATYSRWVQELTDTRAKNAEASVADLDKRITDVQKRLGETPNQRKTKTYQKQLSALQDERSNRIAEMTRRDSPDMRKVRQKLVKADEGMRDLAEKISSAKRQADGEIPSGENEASGLYDVTGPLDQNYASPQADTPARGFNQAWDEIRAQQRASTPVRPSETAALAEADAKAKDYAKPATVETESKALEEWSANDAELVDAQRAAGNLDPADEALLKDGAEIEKQHLDRAKTMEALGQCLIS
jgi:hypothetical protein